MATKSGMGRLTFSGRQEYIAVPFYRPQTNGQQIVGYAAICECTAGNHFLSPSGEHTANATTPLYFYPTYDAAQAAIETWQRQQAHNAAQSGETPPEGV